RFPHPRYLRSMLSRSAMRKKCAIVLIMVSAAALARGQTLESRLLPLIQEHEGDVAVAVKHLTAGEAYRYRADVPQPTASLIKFPVMIEAYRQSIEQGLDLSQPVVLKDSDKVPGSGILTPHFSDGASF